MLRRKKDIKDLYFKNTYSQKVEKFETICRGVAKVYTCGPTLYQSPHIGNMRAYVFADTLRRSLINAGYSTKYVINLTDVGHLTDDADLGDDKVEEEAKKQNISAKEIVKKYEGEFFEYLEKLNIPLKEYRFPKASENIPEQISLIEKLTKKGYTYKTKDGVYFDTSKFKNYGVLGNLKDSKLKEGIRVDLGDKKNSNDFALWKFTEEGIKRQQEWSSPWGKGFPGWHIECSAMAMKFLGEKIDIHTGGNDHIQIHHNNEIAQSEGVTGKPFSRFWMHIAFVSINGEKLSKSLKNSFTLTDIEEKGINPLALKYLFLQSNYHTPLNFSFEALESAEIALNKLQDRYSELPSSLFSRVDKAYIKKIDEAISDNLNTPKVLAIVWDLLKDNKIDIKVKKTTIKYANSFLAILSNRKKEEKQEVSKEIQALIEKRNEARKDGDYEKADNIRKQIEQLGYSLKDTEKGTSLTKNKA